MFVLRDNGERDVPFYALRVSAENFIMAYSGLTAVNIKVVMEKLDTAHRRYSFFMDQKNMSKEKLFTKLTENYNGELVGIDTIIILNDKKYEALDWLDSLVLMEKLAKC